ncbi:Hint domain-containing protein [Vannielia litorea]|uniref:Hint domain-containing protein n=1 Tax=Vannielia litorea TaxID=1217970 RepID=UPI001BCB147D|nr:Hint domain-containing protein [Vannielia litorea]MBS8228125.1 hypothetical protein [Vannielia litorea]
MAIGYRVDLGNGTLESGDAILDGMETFVVTETLGTGSWTWSGTYTGNGFNYNNVTDSGTYFLGSDGNVYFIPDNWFVDPVTTASATSAPAYTEPSGPVDGTAGDDVIDGHYEDSDGDTTDTTGNTINAGAGNDTVQASESADIIDGGAGADTIYAGGGSDTISGGDGADTIHADNPDTVTASDEVLDWTDQGGNATDISGGFTQNTGTMNVSVQVIDDGLMTSAQVSTSTQWTDSGESFDPNSGIIIRGSGNGGGSTPQGTATTIIDFAAVPGSGMTDEVQDVQFRISDIDDSSWDDRITVVAYDAEGNEVPVTFQLDGDDVMWDEDTIDGVGSGPASAQSNSALITIDGPVAQVVIIYENAGNGGQLILYTDVHFTTIPDVDQGDDVVDGGGGDDVIFGYGGDDTLDGGTDDDTIDGGDGADEISGGTGDDVMTGGAGDDSFILENDFGNDTITGGETGEFVGDTIDATALTDDLTVTFSDPESGTISDGTDTASFAEIETVTLGAGNDNVTGSSGGDYIETGAGADTVDMGAGDDTVALGAADGAVDTVVMGDGHGADTVFDFEAPTANGDGTFAGADQIDVSGMTDAGGDPVSVHDVTVTDDGFGSAVLTFPNGESLTLVGVSATDASDPMWLIAAGIPGDGIVSGTSGDDVIDASYADDPHGDMVDAGDAILPGEAADDDIIEAGAGDDTIYGGAGADEIDAGAGDDTVVLEDGFGADEIVGGEAGETTGDTLDATALTGDATVTFTGDEAGTISDGTDTATFSEIEVIETGAGDDVIDGSADTSGFTADGGAGNDVLIGGDGVDTLFGGDDEDTLTGGIGDHVQGGEGGSDFDTLDLTGSGPARVIYDEGDPESGTVEFLDGSGNITGTMTFSEIETVNFIPCFTPGTMIATPEGPRAVETLGPGDRVLTRDHGVKRLQWVGQRLLNHHHLAANPRLMPVRIKAGALGYDLPERDIMVSPQHKMLITDARAEMLFGEHEVLVSAVHLVGLPGIEQVSVEEVVYIHIMFDAHEIVMAEGAWTESYQPGAHVLGEMEDAQRDEIFEIFPELREDANAIVTARMSLKKREVAALFH